MSRRRSDAPPKQGEPVPRIVLAIGLPGSGKSTWFERRKIVPLATDHLRLLLADDEDEQRFQAEIFAALRHLIRKRLDLKRPATYVDATNLTRRFRRQFFEIAKTRPCRIEALYFDVPYEICVDRNRKRGRRVPADVMRAMFEKMTPPSFAEGFHRITTVNASGRTTGDVQSP